MPLHFSTGKSRGVDACHAARHQVGFGVDFRAVLGEHRSRSPFFSRSRRRLQLKSLPSPMVPSWQKRGAFPCDAAQALYQSRHVQAHTCQNRPCSMQASRKEASTTLPNVPSKRRWHQARDTDSAEGGCLTLLYLIDDMSMSRARPPRASGRQDYRYRFGRCSTWQGARPKKDLQQVAFFTATAGIMTSASA